MKKVNYHFSDFVEDFTYYRYIKARAAVKGVTYNGYIYYVDNATPEKLQKIGQYKNVAIFTAISEYAPEQKKTVIFIGHRKAKTEARTV